MHENETKRQQALLIAADLGEYDIEKSLDELEELANTAGADVIGRLTQKRASLDGATAVGSGRIEEVAEFCRSHEVDLLLFDHELNANQIRNVEKICKCTVIDRTMLILDIFAQRARTSEGRLQVELAQQKYMLPRLMGMGESMSRLGGGIGTRGPGETKLESDRRHIRRRISALEEQLEELTTRRNMLRAKRKKDGVVTAAIVGYTNVGKSTLLNALTDAGVLAEDKLFATLDPTSRAILLPEGRSIMLIDTVGLIRRLPHHLVEAFRSTLEEAASADIILHVCDAASGEMMEQVRVTRELLESLGAEDTPVVTIMNKCDCLQELPLAMGENCVLLSAKTGYGFSELVHTIEKVLPPTQKRLTLLVPYAQSGLLHEIRQEGKIFSEEHTEEGTQVDALVDIKILHRLEGMIVSPE